jgi:uncharacterized protein YbjT (DUF2867 family)
VRVLVAGGTGAVGQRVVARLLARGVAVRTLSRDPRRAQRLRGVDVRLGDATDEATLDGVMHGIDAVISCLGASVAMGFAERRSYAAVDCAANLTLLTAAERAGVARFVYLGVHTAPGYAQTRYCLAHERVVEALAAAPVSSTVVRATGVFTAYAPLLSMARAGIGTVVGDGSARSNPIHPDDLAAVCAGALERGPAEIEAGGPDVLTRREMLELAFAALGRRPRIVGVPARAMRLQGRLLGTLHPRLGELMEFLVAVSTHDGIAPQIGQQRLRDWFLQARGAPPAATAAR